MKRTVLTVVGLLLMATGAGAQDAKQFELRTTRDLVKLCDIPANHPLSKEAIGFCLGYIEGIADFHDSLAATERKRIACPPSGTTRRQAARVLIDWAEANPAMMDRPPLEGLLRAAEAKWPCRS